MCLLFPFPLINSVLNRNGRTPVTLEDAVHQPFFLNLYLFCVSLQCGTYTELLEKSGAFAEFLQSYASESQSDNSPGNAHGVKRSVIGLGLRLTTNQFKSSVNSSLSSHQIFLSSYRSCSSLTRPRFYNAPTQSAFSRTSRLYDLALV